MRGLDSSSRPNRRTILPRCWRQLSGLPIAIYRPIPAEGFAVCFHLAALPGITYSDSSASAAAPSIRGDRSNIRGDDCRRRPMVFSAAAFFGLATDGSRQPQDPQCFALVCRAVSFYHFARFGCRLLVNRDLRAPGLTCSSINLRCSALSLHHCA